MLGNRAHFLFYYTTTQCCLAKAKSNHCLLFEEELHSSSLLTWILPTRKGAGKFAINFCVFNWHHSKWRSQIPSAMLISFHQTDFLHGFVLCLGRLETNESMETEIPKSAHSAGTEKRTSSGNRTKSEKGHVYNCSTFKIFIYSGFLGKLFSPLHWPHSLTQSHLISLTIYKDCVYVYNNIN